MVPSACSRSCCVRGAGSALRAAELGSGAQLAKRIMPESEKTNQKQALFKIHCKASSCTKLQHEAAEQVTSKAGGALSAAPVQTGTKTRHSPTWQNLHLIYNIVKVTGKKLNRSVKRPITYYTSVQMSVQSSSMFLSPPGHLWPLSSEIRAGSESGRRRALKNNEQ